MSIWFGALRPEGNDMPTELQGALDPDYLQRFGLP